MVNKVRGEVEVILDGKTYTMVPSFQAMCEIEAVTGLGIVALARRYQSLNFGISDAAAIVTAAIKAGGEDAEVQKVGAMIAKSGLENFATPIAEFLQMALGGPSKGE